MSINDPQIDIDNFDDYVGRRNWLSSAEIEYLLIDFLENDEHVEISIPLFSSSNKE